MSVWVRACGREDINPEDLIRFDHGRRTFAIYRSPEDTYFCTDGRCTHDDIHLANGLVMDNVVECPMHSAQFDYRTGAALRSPACEALKTYPVKVEGDDVYVDIG